MNPSQTVPPLTIPSPRQPEFKLDWENHNFPPCLRLFHFDLDEVQGAAKRFSVKLYSTLLCTYIVLFANGKI